MSAESLMPCVTCKSVNDEMFSLERQYKEAPCIKYCCVFCLYGHKITFRMNLLHAQCTLISFSLLSISKENISLLTLSPRYYLASGAVKGKARLRSLFLAMVNHLQTGFYFQMLKNALSLGIHRFWFGFRGQNQVL